MAKVLTLTFEQGELRSKVIFQFGVKQIEVLIPEGCGVARANAIIDDHGQLTGAEVVTEKL